MVIVYIGLVMCKGSFRGGELFDLPPAMAKGNVPSSLAFRFDELHMVTVDFMLTSITRAGNGGISTTQFGCSLHCFIHFITITIAFGLVGSSPGRPAYTDWRGSPIEFNTAPKYWVAEDVPSLTHIPTAATKQKFLLSSQFVNTQNPSPSSRLIVSQSSHVGFVGISMSPRRTFSGLGFRSSSMAFSIELSIKRQRSHCSADSFKDSRLRWNGNPIGGESENR
jgi:hypothetical protein